MRFTADKGYHKYKVAKKIEKDKWSDTLPTNYWEYRRKWERNPLDYIVDEYPLHLGIEITSHCHLKCTFCIRTTSLEEGKFRDVKHMPYEMFKQIVDESSNYDLYGFCLNGIGEPLMHPDLVKMIRYSKEVGGMIDVMFHTAGMLLKPELSEEIIKAGLDQIIFSVDGSGKEEYEAKRVGAKYDTVENNLKRFKEIKDKLGMKLPIIRLTMIIDDKTTEQSVDGFLSIWNDIADVITFQEIGTYAYDSGDERLKELARTPDFVCAQPWQRLAVDCNGHILPCCEALSFKDEMILGKIGEDTIYDVWHGAELTKLRDLHKNHRYQERPMCNKCSLTYNLK